MTTPYTKCLESSQYEGVIGSINVAWKGDPKKRLASDEARFFVPADNLKAITEHFAVLVAEAFDNRDARITGEPHDFTVKTGTNIEEPDDLHVVLDLQGPSRGGRHRVHIYLEGAKEKGEPNRFDNLRIGGLLVRTRMGGNMVINPELSTSNYVDGGTYELTATV